MIFDKHESLCKPNAKKIVSRDKGTQRRHIAENPEQKFEVRQYQLDRDVFQNVMCCDYLLLNDTSKMAYYIELKGSDIGHAAEQLQAGEKLCAGELSEYTFLFRIVASRMPTQRAYPLSYRKLMNRVGTRLKSATGEMVEELQ